MYNIKHTTVSGHKCFIKFRIPIDLRVFLRLRFNFLYVNKSSFCDKTYMKTKQNNFYTEI